MRSQDGPDLVNTTTRAQEIMSSRAGAPYGSLPGSPSVVGGGSTTYNGPSSAMSNASRGRFSRTSKIILAAAALLAILTVAIVPAAVVTTRNNDGGSAQQQNVAIVDTTVVDGVTRTITRTGALQTRTRLETLEGGQIVTATTVLTQAPVTVSRTNTLDPRTDYVTTTINDEVVVVLTVTELEAVETTLIQFITNGQLVTATEVVTVDITSLSTVSTISTLTSASTPTLTSSVPITTTTTLSSSSTTTSFTTTTQPPSFTTTTATTEQPVTTTTTTTQSSSSTSPPPSSTTTTTTEQPVTTTSTTTQSSSSSTLSPSSTTTTTTTTDQPHNDDALYQSKYKLDADFIAVRDTFYDDDNDGRSNIHDENLNGAFNNDHCFFQHHEPFIDDDIWIDDLDNLIHVYISDFSKLIVNELEHDAADQYDYVDLASALDDAYLDHPSSHFDFFVIFLNDLLLIFNEFVRTTCHHCDSDAAWDNFDGHRARASDFYFNISLVLESHQLKFKLFHKLRANLLFERVLQQPNHEQQHFIRNIIVLDERIEHEHGRGDNFIIESDELQHFLIE
ncbi:hypothetical protein ACM66B_004510 [Microbotryomycetes sp. NB124-2]